VESVETTGEPAPAPHTGPAVSELISRVAACVVELARAIHDLELLVELPDAELARLAAGVPDPDAAVEADRTAAPADGADASEFSLFAEESNLTRREAEVLRHLLYGHSNRRISRSLRISESTVKNHLHAIFVKLHASDRTQVITKAYRFMAEHNAADRARQAPPRPADVPKGSGSPEGSEGSEGSDSSGGADAPDGLA
jgi:DNA-binding CsgD family transcriptional regulator